MTNPARHPDEARDPLRMGELILFYKRFHPDCGPESPFILPSETGTEPDGIRHQEQKHEHIHMPDISTFTESKYLKRADVGTGKLLTIQDCTQQNVAKADAPPEMKWCLHFAETDKPMVLNRTNAELIGMITGERNSDNWGGHKVVLYDDPSISYGGKLVGGIRVRAPRNKTAAAPSKPPVKDLPAEEDAPEDDIPF